MRPSGLLGRSILTSVAVAAVAMVATALLTVNLAQSSLERQRVKGDDLDRSTVERLLDVGRSSSDWRGAGTVLRQLATGDRQIVLTDLDRRTLARSSDPGAAPSATTDPTAVLDPLAGIVQAAVAHVSSSYRTLGLPDAYLTAGGRTSPLRPTASRYPVISVCAQALDEVDHLPQDPGSHALRLDTCSRPHVSAGHGTGTVASTARLNNTVVNDEYACLTRRDVPVLLTQLSPESGSDDPDLLTLGVVTTGEKASASTTQAWRDCVTATLTRDLQSHVAPKALLYISQTRPTTRSLVDRVGRLHIAAALGAVLLVAVGLSLIASRRMLRPVHRLTAATRRMADGELSTRVDVRGRDEVAGLGRSFNDMASALSSAEQQRQRMVSDIAHELRTPLSNIRGYLEAGHDGVLERDEAWTSSLIEEAALLEHIVDDLQVLAQADAGRLAVHVEPGDLVPTVDLAIQAMSARADVHGIRLERVGDDAALSPHDRMRIRQVIGNLLSNAIRHSPAGSTVTITVTAGDPVVIKVRDRGEGIPEDHLTHVFERFHRVDPSRSRETGGSGLGLAIVEQIVLAHGGSVTAVNASDGGAVLTVSLPPG